ncbi:hypothetical protein, partial [Propionibacterium freudenreichii]|uniref:hypothetical protein n=1 Tax=Propionibacterium freudenreichii TaxID=1744 RepID=UPI003851A42B
MELMEMIQSLKYSQRFLEENFLKPGCKASEVESYSMLSEKLLTAIKELRILNMDIINVNLAQKRLQQALEIKT